MFHTDAHRLGNEEHIGDLAPRIRVDVVLVVRVDRTRTEL